MQALPLCLAVLLLLDFCPPHLLWPLCSPGNCWSSPFKSSPSQVLGYLQFLWTWLKGKFLSSLRPFFFFFFCYAWQLLQKSSTPGFREHPKPLQPAEPYHASQGILTSVFREAPGFVELSRESLLMLEEHRYSVIFLYSHPCFRIKLLFSTFLLPAPAKLATFFD